MGLDLTYINPKAKDTTRNIAVGMLKHVSVGSKKKIGLRTYVEFELAIFDECHECTSDFLHEYFSDKFLFLGLLLRHEDMEDETVGQFI